MVDNMTFSQVIIRKANDYFNGNLHELSRFIGLSPAATYNWAYYGKIPNREWVLRLVMERLDISQPVLDRIIHNQLKRG